MKPDGVRRQHGARGAHRRGRALRDAAQRPARRRGARRARRGAAAARQPVPRRSRTSIVTPHLGGATTDVTRHQSDIVVDAMERWLRGERPRWIANPAVLDAARLSVARDVLVTLDAGTGSGRCVVFDSAGSRSSAPRRSRCAYHFFADPDLPLVRGFDLDPVAFWDALGRCARAALGAAAGRRPHPRRHRHRAARGLRVPRRRGRGALRRAEPRRARGRCRAWRCRAGSRPSACTPSPGTRRRTSSPVSRLLWFRQHHDARAHRDAVHAERLDRRTCSSGARVAEHSNASESMLYDVTRARLVGRDPGHARHPARDPAGAVRRRRAGRPRDRRGRRGDRHPGGHARCSPAAPTPRARCSAAACYDAGQTRRGARHDHARAAGARRAGARLRTATCGPARTSSPDRWVLESNGGDTGSTYRWLLDLICGGVDDGAHAAAEAAMAAVDSGPAADLLPPRSRGLQPAQHESVPAGGPALPLPAAAHRPPEPRRAAARLLRERRLRDPWQLRADRGGRGRCRPTPLGERRHDAKPDAARGSSRRRSACRSRVAEVPESASLGCAILAAVGAGLHPERAGRRSAAMVRTRDRRARPGVHRRVRRALPALARDVRVLAELDAFERHPRPRHARRHESRACASISTARWSTRERAAVGGLSPRARPTTGSTSTSRSTGATSSPSPAARSRPAGAMALPIDAATLRARKARGLPRADRARRAADARGARLPRAAARGLAARRGDQLDARRGDDHTRAARDSHRCSTPWSRARTTSGAKPAPDAYLAAAAALGPARARLRRGRGHPARAASRRARRACASSRCRASSPPTRTSPARARRLARSRRAHPRSPARRLERAAVTARADARGARRHQALRLGRGRARHHLHGRARARSSASSGRTAPARRPPCASWRASSRPRSGEVRVAGHDPAARAARLPARRRLLPRARAVLSRAQRARVSPPSSRALKRLPRAARAERGRARARRLRARGRGAPARRHAVEGLPPARRAGPGAVRRSADPDPRRADDRPRSGAGGRDPRAGARAARQPDGAVLEPHPLRGRGALRAGGRDRPRPHRRRGHAAELAARSAAPAVVLRVADRRCGAGRAAAIPGAPRLEETGPSCSRERATAISPASPAKPCSAPARASRAAPGALDLEDIFLELVRGGARS